MKLSIVVIQGVCLTTNFARFATAAERLATSVWAASAASTGWGDTTNMKHPTHSFRDVRNACHKWLREHDLLEPWELAMETPEEETPEDKERRRRMWNKHPGRKKHYE